MFTWLKFRLLVFPTLEKLLMKPPLNVKKAIQLYIETLIDLKKSIPAPDSDDYFVTSNKIEVNLPVGSFAY